MAKRFFSWHKIWAEVQALLDETLLTRQGGLTKLHRFAHFWVMVWKSFVRNRLPVRASALTYTTLLALIPMLAVVMSITSTFLKKEGVEAIDQFIVKMVATVTPPAIIKTNAIPAFETNNAADLLANTSPTPARESVGPGATLTNLATGTLSAGGPTNGVQASQSNTATNGVAVPAFVQAEDAVQARKLIATKINEFIQSTRSGALGLTGSILLIIAAISMLSQIESTFNDVWGVARGRSWFMRIVLYWAVLSLAPLLLVTALGVASGPHLESTKELLHRMPFVGSLVFEFLPVVLVCLTFSLFYILMPNTKVRWTAALVGGMLGGVVFHLYNMASVFYVSRWVSNSKIYGSLGVVPVVMIGMYFSWLFLLFGAQVAYAFQNRGTYVEEKQIENINQRGREFVALRLMTVVGLRFLKGEPPLSVVGMGEELGVPTRLVRQVMQTLSAARLVVETASQEPSYLPARPLETITCHDLLLAMRASQGQELATRDDATRTDVYGEFNRIEEAERQVASSVTMLALANRARLRLGNRGEEEHEHPELAGPIKDRV
jgi:membrane protein